MSDSSLRVTRRRTLQAMAGALAALALSDVDAAQTAAAQDTKNRYSSKVLDLVQRSLVIDMLAPLKLDFRPEAYALPLTDS
jgi:membrane dipeptidase